MMNNNDMKWVAIMFCGLWFSMGMCMAIQTWSEERTKQEAIKAGIVVEWPITNLDGEEE